MKPAHVIELVWWIALLANSAAVIVAAKRGDSFVMFVSLAFVGYSAWELHARRPK